MNKRVFSVVLVAVAMALLLSACRLPASSAPAATATPQAEVPFPVATNSDLVNEFLFATQTAIAGGQTNPPDMQAGGGAETPSADQAGGGNPTDQTGGGVETPTADQAGGGTTTGDQAGGGTTTGDQAGGGTAGDTTTDQSGGGGVTTDQAGGGTTTDQSGGGSPTAVPNYQLPPAPARPATYTIQHGEYPYCIARRYNIDPGALMRANNLGVSSQLPIGSVISIPASGNWDVASYGTRSRAAHPATYTVQSGDTLKSVACKFGDVYPEWIAAANGLDANAALTPGAVINIP